MFTGLAILGLVLKLLIVIGVVVFAVKLLNRVTDIARSQKSIAESQIQLIDLLSVKTMSQSDKPRG